MLNLHIVPNHIKSAMTSNCRVQHITSRKIKRSATQTNSAKFLTIIANLK